MQQIAKVLQQIDIITLYERIILREILQGINFRCQIPTRENLYPRKKNLFLQTLIGKKINKVSCHPQYVDTGYMN